MQSGLFRYIMGVHFSGASVKRGFTVNAVQECLHECVKVQSTDLLTHALIILATHGWKRSKNTRVRHEALECLYTVRCDMRRWIALL